MYNEIENDTFREALDVIRRRRQTEQARLEKELERLKSKKEACQNDRLPFNDVKID
jgi:hypothetical protein